MVTYLITGGAGFIGSSLCERLLKENNKVIVIDNFCDFYNPNIKEKNIKSFLDNYNFKLYRYDIRDFNLIKSVFHENKIDIVVHLAAMAGVRNSIENPILYQEVNCMGTQNILEAMRLNNVKNLIMASSSSVYGNCKTVPFKEDMIVDYAISPYAATKKANEVMTHVYHEIYNFNVMMLRFFTAYGPKQRPDLAISKFTKLMLNNEEIPMYGDGSTSRDYTYIDDIIDGIIKASDYALKNNTVYEIINIGNSKPIALKDMIQTIASALGIEAKTKQYPMQPGDVDRTYADISKAKKLLGYEPKISFEKGIKNFVKWYKENVFNKEVKKEKIAVAGIGYVGLSLATLLSQKNEVVAYDINKNKVELVNNRVSPIKDNEIEDYFRNKELNLRATLDYEDAFKNAEYIIICTPTNYDEEKNFFDISNVEDIIEKVNTFNSEATIIIKSTVPVGFTKKVKEKYKRNNIIFSPEFLREGKALYDNLYPSRIVIGEKSERAEKFAKILQESAIKKDIPVKFMDSIEAEAVKLFSNTYLALRIAYFNELDTYAELKNLNTLDIIEGVSLDPRIGSFYNNPSFGYGGYCLPKDTKQLLANYDNIPQNLIGAIINSNQTRKNYIVETVVSKKPKTVGIYKLVMKSESDNFRNSAIQEIIEGVKKTNSEVVIYEPNIKESEFKGCKVIKNYKEFAEKSDIILANRFDSILENDNKKVYTRDIFYRD